MIAFTAYGIPIPKGSARGFVLMKANQRARAIITSDNRKTRPWAEIVAAAATQAREAEEQKRSLRAAATDEELAAAVAAEIPGEPRPDGPRGPFYPDEAVGLVLLFRLPRPKNAPPHREVHQRRKPDKDKLERAVKDAMTAARIYGDDAQVVFSASFKCFPGNGRTLHAWTDKAPEAIRKTWGDWPEFAPGVDVYVGPLGEILDTLDTRNPVRMLLEIAGRIDRAGLEAPPRPTRWPRLKP